MLAVCVVRDFGAIFIGKLVAAVYTFEIFGPDMLFTMRTGTVFVKACPRDRKHVTGSPNVQSSAAYRGRRFFCESKRSDG